MDRLLAVREVVKHFSTATGILRAVDGVSFNVKRGAITGLLGRNGAGKTTIIRMITGIFLPDRGTIEAPPRDRIGYLPEERGLYKHMRIHDHLVFLAEIKGRRGAKVKTEAERWLRRLELWDRRDTKIEELSKGNQQKVQLIGALVHAPELVILDEPMSGLDPVNVVLVRRILGELKAEGRSILLSTHMMSLAESMADDVILMNEGKIVLEGDLDTVRASQGRNTVHLEFDGDGTFLTHAKGVARAQLQNNVAEIVLAPDGDAQALLAACIGRIRVRKFEVATPSLETIFVSHVGTESMRPAALALEEEGAP